MVWRSVQPAVFKIKDPVIINRLSPDQHCHGPTGATTEGWIGFSLLTYQLSSLPILTANSSPKGMMMHSSPSESRRRAPMSWITSHSSRISRLIWVKALWPRISVLEPAAGLEHDRGVKKRWGSGVQGNVKRLDQNVQPITPNTWGKYMN